MKGYLTYFFVLFAVLSSSTKTVCVSAQNIASTDFNKTEYQEKTGGWIGCKLSMTKQYDYEWYNLTYGLIQGLYSTENYPI